MKTRTLVAVLALLVAAGCSVFVGVDHRPPPPRAADVGPGAVHPAHLGIPPGHLPPPGECRIWIPGRPPGHQSRPGSCSALERSVPPGGWLLYRPARDRKHVEVFVYDGGRAGASVVRVYDAKTGRFVAARR